MGVAGVTMGLLVACGGHGQVGFSSAPGITRSWSPAEDYGRNPNANGPESCARSGRAADDPLPQRLPRGAASPCVTSGSEQRRKVPKR